MFIFKQGQEGPVLWASSATPLQPRQRYLRRRMGPGDYGVSCVWLRDFGGWGTGQDDHGLLPPTPPSAHLSPFLLPFHSCQTGSIGVFPGQANGLTQQGPQGWGRDHPGQSGEMRRNPEPLWLRAGDGQQVCLGQVENGEGEVSSAPSTHPVFRMWDPSTCCSLWISSRAAPPTQDRSQGTPAGGWEVPGTPKQGLT